MQVDERARWRPQPRVPATEMRAHREPLGCPGTSPDRSHTTLLVHSCVCAKLLHSCLTLCDPVEDSPPGSSIHGILQARILEWVAMPSSRGSSRPRDRTHISYIFCIGRRVLYP